MAGYFVVVEIDSGSLAKDGGGVCCEALVVSLKETTCVVLSAIFTIRLIC